MIQRVSFQNFRGFRDLELSELAQITLLSGKNNVGKSTVLDGLFLLIDHCDPMCFVKICNFRGLPVVPDFDILWKPFFYQLNTDNSIQISAHLEHNIELTFRRENSYSPLPQDFKGMSPDMLKRFMSSAQNGYTLGFQLTQNSYKEIGHFVAGPDGFALDISTSLPNNQTIPMPFTQMINSQIANLPSAELFGKLELDGRKVEILDILKKMDPSLFDISAIAINGQTQLYGNMGGKLLPMRLAGDGMNRLLMIMLSIMENPNSIVLIDEIENGFHYSMYPVLWEAVANAAQKSNCQVIATTHSYECVAGAVEGIEKTGMKDKFCFFRLAQEKNGRVAYRYSEDLLQYALESDVEVR